MEELKIDDIDTLNQDKTEILESLNESLQDDSITEYDEIIENFDQTIDDNTTKENITDSIENIENIDDTNGVDNIDDIDSVENIDTIDDIENIEDIQNNNSNLFSRIEHISDNEDIQDVQIDSQEADVINENISNENNPHTSSNDSDLINNPCYKVLLDYGENLTTKDYITNPAIGRDNEIKQLIVILLTPEKSGILVGKPGIGKTAIVEGLSYKIKNNDVPNALKGYNIFKLNSASLTGTMPGTNELKIQYIVNNLKNLDKIMVFIDEIHTLIGNGESMDFANIFKPVIDRGSIKIIGATTSDEYDRYILRDKAFVRRFQKIEVSEPTREMNINIMMGTYPKFENRMNLKLNYSDFIKEKIMAFLTDITTEFKRVYEISARYPDISLTILQQAFSYAAFDNRDSVSIRDVRKAIATTKLIYPDVIKKELVRFNEVFKDIYLAETKQILKDEI